MHATIPFRLFVPQYQRLHFTSLSTLIFQMFLHKLKVIEAHKTWMKNPEDLGKCSTGLHFLTDPSEKPSLQVTEKF